MAKIVQTSDFVGLYSITQNQFSKTNLQAFIDKFEKVYLYDLLGITLGNLFLADINTPYAPPVNTDYLAVYNMDLKEMLVAFIYWEFTRNQPVQNTIVGNIVAQNEASAVVDFNNTNIFNIHNVAVKIFHNIQWYVKDNYTVFTNYAGKCNVINHWSI